jgi:hypothetical protein
METSLRVASVAEATGRHAEAEVPVGDVTDIPDETEIPHQPEV